jgi:hypothetical protein
MPCLRVLIATQDQELTTNVERRLRTVCFAAVEKRTEAVRTGC